MLFDVSWVKPIKQAKLEGRKIVLYGPNGAGKSTIIHLAMLMLSKVNASADWFTRNHALHDDKVVNTAKISEESRALLEAEVGGEKLIIRAAGRQLEAAFRDVKVSVDMFSSERKGLAEIAVWHVDERGLQYAGSRLCRRPIEAEEGFYIKVTCPQLAKMLVIEGEVYYDAAEVDGEWIPIENLSYGQRRFLAIQAALHSSDFVFIENFEAGLHVDYIVRLLERAASTDGVVVLETHSGLVLKTAMREGFDLYKVEDGEAKKISELTDSEMFQREMRYLAPT